MQSSETHGLSMQGHPLASTEPQKVLIHQTKDCSLTAKDRRTTVVRGVDAEPPQSIEENEACPTKKSIRVSIFSKYTLPKHNEVVSSISCRSTNSEVQMLS